ncbi:MAG: hypothetical protein AB4426_13510 [Xenococcaceae cyanobacterium]
MTTDKLNDALDNYDLALKKLGDGSPSPSEEQILAAIYLSRDSLYMF